MFNRYHENMNDGPPTLYNSLIPNLTYTCIFSSSSWPVRRFCTMIFAEFFQESMSKTVHPLQHRDLPLQVYNYLLRLYQGSSYTTSSEPGLQ